MARAEIKSSVTAATREALAERPTRRVQSYLAFSVTSYTDDATGDRQAEYRAVVLDGVTHRMVSHHLGTVDDVCQHEACAVADLADRAKEWAMERASEDTWQGREPRQLELW